VHLDRAKAVGRIDRFLAQYLPAALIAQAEPLEIGARSGATLHLNAAAPAAIDSVASEGVRLTLRPFEVVTLRFARSAEGALGA
jgi:hypothetical protein